MSDPDNPPLLIEPRQLVEIRARGEPVVFVDVRSAEEHAAGTVEGAIHIPAAELPSRIGELSAGALVITVCNHGGPRSCGAAERLRTLGFPRAVALKGGVHGSHKH